MTAARCLVVDDHPGLLLVVTNYLTEHDLDVCGTASDGRRAVAAAAEQHPDVIVADYRLPHLERAELIGALREVAPAARVVVYTADADARVVDETLRAGASAVVLKAAPLADLGRAIEAVLAGHIYVDPELAPRGIAGGPSTPTLTPREADVLRLLAEGLSHDEIAARLNIGTETVRTHVRKATERLGASTRTQAVATALRLGLIT